MPARHPHVHVLEAIRRRDRLTFYKDGDDEQRDRYAPEVAAIVERFFAEHGGRLEEITGGWDVACVVPSESRQPPDPLDVALQQLPAINAPTREILLRPRARGGRVAKAQ